MADELPQEEIDAAAIAENVEPDAVVADAETTGSREANLDAILDVPVTIALEVGRTSVPIKELLALGQGSVVELDSLVGKPHKVLVNGTLIAHGEVVVIDDKFGIRFIDIVSPSERVQKLK
jgi:flagellar motor switch protein FliN/FliY